ncbi:methylenetetrahydrofolate reductase [NAD(P)H] [Clostridium isatidis]|jgi:methylenetetrahydrofolate reductase (NADPH)|uniref:Methylenetetrahydrofolate reductase n=1 Tax=Clostridium isatidis TaxID=182773 RepID=A0A343JF99_9CLOT|nr:methylenetetrahydrofolate reductase [NAD(P)H] [Clostridium isatidis]ASW44207.1 methylenetetrahydrofolate reductase [NAD(P)H] [Clostridium isatidis]
MKTCELFKVKRVLSFEIFPPKRTDSVNIIYDTIEKLKGINPDFISVTYGAGGSESSSNTLKIASDIKNKYGLESVAHLPCINLTKGEVLKMLDDFKKAGIENILALRGDVNTRFILKNDFKYASDLISFIKENGDFNIIAACYPEGHFESSTIIEDIRNLKRKVDAGANQLITQLFFDNNYFYSFRERAAIAGINVPIEAGIMPVVNKKQIERLISLCRANLPKKFLTIMTRYENNPEAMRDAGIAYAVDQIVDLIAQGVDGIHLYTMNNPYIAHRIYEAINTLLVA